MSRLLLLLSFLFTFQSCELSCTVNDKKENKENKDNVVFKDGVRLSNEIALDAEDVKVDKAYLIFEDGKPVPAGNIVDFTQPVKLILVIEKGWKEENGKVWLGASEKIETESGEVLLDEKDLFENAYSDGISAEDARFLSLSAIIKLTREINPLTTFNVSFRVWDKKGDGLLQGRYKLYSK